MINTADKKYDCESDEEIMEDEEPPQQPQQPAQNFRVGPLNLRRKQTQTAPQSKYDFSDSDEEIMEDEEPQTAPQTQTQTPQQQDDFPNDFILTEEFDADALYYIVESKTEEIHDNPLQIAASYLEASYLTPLGWRVDVKYLKDECGRSYAFKGIGQQSLKRNIRHTITQGRYVDIDIINCHPVLLRHICDKNNIKCPLLASYAEDRKGFIKKYKTNKKAVLAIINGGNDDAKTIQPFIAEIQRIHRELSEKHAAEFKEFEEQKTAAARTDVFNILGKFVNRMLTRLESKILYQIWNYYGKPNEAVLCFDGIQVLAEMTDVTEKALRQIEEIVYDTVNIRIGLKVKAMDEIVPLPKRLPKYDPEKRAARSTQQILRELISNKNLYNSNPLDVHGNGIKYKNGKFISSEQNAAKAIRRARKNTKTTIDLNYYKKQHCEEIQLSPETPTLYMVSGMGTGKTFQVEKFFDNPDICKPNTRILIPTFRRSLAAEHMDRFRENGFVHYQDIKTYYITDKYPKVIIQIESFGRLKWSDYPEYMFVDEVESLMSQFFSSTMKKSSSIFLKFEAYLRQTTYLIAADAHLSTLNLELFQNMRRKPAKIAINSYNTVNRKLRLTTDQDIWLQSLHKDITAGLKIVIPVNVSVENQKVLIQTIEKMFPDLVGQTIYVNSETQKTGEHKDLLEDKKKWSEFRVFSYTPTFQAGVSYEGTGDDAYDVIYAHFCNNSTISSLLQMLGRFRTIKTKKINMLVQMITDGQGARYTTEKEFIKYQSLQRAYRKKMYANTQCDEDIIPDGVHWEADTLDPSKIVFPNEFKNALYKNWVNHSTESEKDRVFFPWRLMSKLRHIGFKDIQILGESKRFSQYNADIKLNFDYIIMPKGMIARTQKAQEKWLDETAKGFDFSRRAVRAKYRLALEIFKPHGFNIEEFEKKKRESGARRISYVKFEKDILPELIKLEIPPGSDAYETLMCLKSKVKHTEKKKKGNKIQKEIKGNKQENKKIKATQIVEAKTIDEGTMDNLRKKIKNGDPLTKEQLLSLEKYWLFTAWNIAPDKLETIPADEINDLLSRKQIKWRETHKALQKGGNVEDSLSDLLDKEYKIDTNRNSLLDNYEKLSVENSNNAFTYQLGEEIFRKADYRKFSMAYQLYKRLCKQKLCDLDEPQEIDLKSRIVPVYQWLRRKKYFKYTELCGLFGISEGLDIGKWVKDPRKSLIWINKILDIFGIKIQQGQGEKVAARVTCSSIWIQCKGFKQTNSINKLLLGCSAA